MYYDLSELVKDWSWFCDFAGHHLLKVSPFGDLLLQDSSSAILLLDVNLGAVQYAAFTGTEPAALFPLAFDDQIAAGYREAGLHLAEGQCYGYKIPSVAGGSMDASNVYLATTLQYLSFLGDFHEQIQDVPDGGSITLKVINKQVIH